MFVAGADVFPLAILVYVNLLTIGFAVWNLTVLKGLGDQGELFQHTCSNYSAN